MTDPFQPSRSDGRSDRRVIYELTSQSEPDTLWPYDDIEAALSQDLDDEITRERIYNAVRAANIDLLRERDRYLSVVRNTGYRLIRAEEHLPVALGRKSLAVTQMARGVELLRNVKLCELSGAQRQLHEGQLMIMGALHTAIVDSERRHARTEAVLDEIKARQEANTDEVNRRLEALEHATG